MDKLWLYAAACMMAALLPCLITVFRGKPGDRLAALEMGSVIVTLEMVLLAQGYHRPVMYDLALTLALLSFGGGMVFARFLERWL
ncbi:MAG TPA: MrpF/PhaF family protein [Tepidisphaeraceae bacterium]|nr:MrpF/PhaF family protein [Tepidisphaeraceae bacterium]